MAFPTEQDLRSYLEPLAAEAGADVEYVTVTRAGAKSAVRVAVDGDPRPDVDRLEELSHRVSEAFDAAEERGDLSFGPGYTLEVTTPGVDMPLTQLRHWRRNVGRLVALPQGGGTVRVAGQAVDLAIDAREIGVGIAVQPDLRVAGDVRARALQ